MKSNQVKSHELVVQFMIDCQLAQQNNICKSQMGQDQVSGGVNLPCQYATPVANVLWKLLGRDWGENFPVRLLYLMIGV